MIGLPDLANALTVLKDAPSICSRRVKKIATSHFSRFSRPASVLSFSALAKTREHSTGKFASRYFWKAESDSSDLYSNEPETRQTLSFLASDRRPEAAGVLVAELAFRVDHHVCEQVRDLRLGRACRAASPA